MASGPTGPSGAAGFNSRSASGLLETPRSGPYVHHHLCSLAFVCLCGRRGTFSPTTSYSPSSPVDISTLSRSTSNVIWWPDSHKCFNSCLVTMKGKHSPSHMCTIGLGEKSCIPMCLHSAGLWMRALQGLVPAGLRRNDLGKDGHCSESTSENTQLYKCAFCLGKSRKQRSQISP